MNTKNWTQRTAVEKATARNESVEGIQDYLRSSEGGSRRGEVRGAHATVTTTLNSRHVLPAYRGPAEG